MLISSYVISKEVMKNIYPAGTPVNFNRSIRFVISANRSTERHNTPALAKQYSLNLVEL